VTTDGGPEPVEAAPRRGSGMPERSPAAAPPPTARRCPPTVVAETMVARRSRLLGELDALLERLDGVELGTR
jgi:hypothetical protein